ncbi:exodeoxyribonuclease III [Paradesertivirga mongoliensis]|uniref:Exodeoxyribonuclease III n=1 Tax=Paradesertivirga mongoliensis TaxID=2100740 RepID=A0ABW4ZLH8_9SPHI|nr:exodeoxyribonuclease III [Pedobacter mongoliensis]
MPSLHLLTWNVNGLRSICKKDFIKDIQALDPDILCLQETKASTQEVRALCELLPGYHVYANSSKARKGYSGTAILSKREPISQFYDIGNQEHDQEGRVITAEYEDFILVTVYAPNAGDGLKRLDYRKKWDTDFINFISILQSKKPVIICGDLNVAHQPIDIARAKENYNKAPGYTQPEIDGFKNLLNCSFTDTFRHLHPTEIKYTYWNQLFNARARNRGWRIDYILVSNELIPRVKEASIYNEYMGSDHCPAALKIDI